MKTNARDIEYEIVEAFDAVEHAPIDFDAKGCYDGLDADGQPLSIATDRGAVAARGSTLTRLMI